MKRAVVLLFLLLGSCSAFMPNTEQLIAPSTDDQFWNAVATDIEDWLSFFTLFGL